MNSSEPGEADDLNDMWNEFGVDDDDKDEDGEGEAVVIDDDLGGVREKKVGSGGGSGVGGSGGSGGENGDALERMDVEVDNGGVKEQPRPQPTSAAGTNPQVSVPKDKKNTNTDKSTKDGSKSQHKQQQQPQVSRRPSLTPTAATLNTDKKKTTHFPSLITPTSITQINTTRTGNVFSSAIKAPAKTTTTTTAAAKNRRTTMPPPPPVPPSSLHNHNRATTPKQHQPASSTAAAVAAAATPHNSPAKSHTNLNSVNSKASTLTGKNTALTDLDLTSLCALLDSSALEDELRQCKMTIDQGNEIYHTAMEVSAQQDSNGGKIEELEKEVEDVGVVSARVAVQSALDVAFMKVDINLIP